MAKYEIDPYPSDKMFLELPRVYEDIPTETLKEVLEAMEKFTGAIAQYESVIGRELPFYYKTGMKAPALTMVFRHDETVAIAVIQVLAELTLRVHLSGDDANHFIKRYALENAGIFFGFDTQAVTYLVTVWEDGLSI